MSEHSKLTVFQQALLEASILDYEETKREVPGKIRVSIREKIKIKRYLRKLFKEERRQYAERLKQEEKENPPRSIFSYRIPLRKRLVLALIAVALCLVGCTAYVNRMEVANFIQEVFSDHAKVSPKDDSSNNNAPSTIETEYTLTFLPEGYEYCEEESIVNFMNINRVWKNADKYIFFYQNTLQSANYFDIERNECEVIVLENISLYYRMENGYKVFMWTDGSYVYKIEFMESFSDEIVKNLILGVKN